jgi:tRNA (cmo5U34)-methyltransferase
MCSQDTPFRNGWNEDNTQEFIDYGRYFVPEREHQYQIVVDLVPDRYEPHSIIDLCCGEGLLSQLFLEQRMSSIVYGLDNSEEMLKRSQERLSRFENRLRLRKFDLSYRCWPEIEEPIQAVVSCLAIHHLDGSQKQALFSEIYGMLDSGGVFLVSDIIEPAHALGWKQAANEWDEAVRERSLQLDGNFEGFFLFDQMRWKMYRYFDPQDIDKPSRLFDQLKYLEQTGFVDIDVHWMRAGHAIFGGLKA